MGCTRKLQYAEGSDTWVGACNTGGLHKIFSQVVVPERSQDKS